MMATIKIEGVDKLIKKLGTVEGVKVLEKPMRRSVMRLQSDMAKYPAQRAGSAYVRTGTLGRRWTVKVNRSQSGLLGKVGNNTEYAPFVQSARFQARIHSSRWQTDEIVVNRNAQTIINDFKAAIDRELNK